MWIRNSLCNMFCVKCLPGDFSIRNCPLGTCDAIAVARINIVGNITLCIFRGKGHLQDPFLHRVAWHAYLHPEGCNTRYVTFSDTKCFDLYFPLGPVRTGHNVIGILFFKKTLEYMIDDEICFDFRSWQQALVISRHVLACV